MNHKYLLVVERSESQLTIQKEDDKYVLEGVFTEIGVKNNNNRIYDEKEILPHIEELKKACAGNKLLGELDHPKSFDISLKNASHVIEDISYNSDTKQVTGRIRLLNTDAGKNAKALVDAGVPIHISSRAAGVVESNGHVKIKKMFTYDLVANPGFSNAELKRVNESLGFEDQGPVQLYEVPWSLESEAMSDDVKESTSTEEKGGTDDSSKLENFQTTEPIKENKEMDSTKYISIEDFNAYSKLVKEEFDKLRDKSKSLEEKLGDTSVNEGIIKYTEAMAKRINELGENMTKVNESIEGLISHNDYIIESLEKVKDYAELIGERSNQGINYTEKLTESVDAVIEYMRLVAEKTDQNIEYTKYIAEESSNRWNYQTSMNEELDKVISHNDYIVEGVDSVAKFSNYLKENIENLGKYVSLVVEQINEGIEVPAAENVNETETEEPAKETTITESVNFSNEKSEDEFKNDVTASLNAILESAEADKRSKEDNKYHFLNFLAEDKRNVFDQLPAETQERIVEAFQKNRYFGSAEAEKIWESCFKTPVKKIDWLANMPGRFVSSWNGLNESQKNAIKAQASVRVLDTQYKIDDFWATRDLGKIGLVNENENNERPVNESSEYKSDDNYMNSVVNGLRKYRKF